MAVENDHVEIVRFLVGLNGIKINMQDYLKDTALHAAVRGQKVDIVKILLSSKNIDVNLKNSAVLNYLFFWCFTFLIFFHKTPFEIAQESNNAQILELFTNYYKDKDIS